MSQELLRRHHHQIGRTVREYLENLKNEELVERIEARVGADLQFIRLNGAVIGGLVGIAPRHRSTPSSHPDAHAQFNSSSVIEKLGAKVARK